jgi:hypothetical protein
MLKGLLRIRRYNQQETPYALQEVEELSWLQFGEAYSALRGWRPIPAALLSHSVLLCSGTEDISLPTSRSPSTGIAPNQGKNIPDKQQSISKKIDSVKSVSKHASGNLCGNQSLGAIFVRHDVIPGPSTALHLSESIAIGPELLSLRAMIHYSGHNSMIIGSLPKCYRSITFIFSAVCLGTATWPPWTT